MSDTASTSTPDKSFHFSMSLLDPYFRNLNKVFDIFHSKGNKLVLDDLGRLPEEVSVEKISPIFEKEWGEEMKKAKTDRSLFGALIRACGGVWNLLKILLLQSIVVALSFAIPQLTSAISNHQSGISDLSIPVYHLLIALMFICPFLASHVSARYSMNLAILQSQMGSALISRIYNKCLKLGPGSKHSQGQITVMYTTDITNVKTFPTMIMTAVFAPAQAAVALALIYEQVGVAMFVGLAVIVVVTPITAVIVYLMTSAINARRTAQGERVKFTNDVFNGIKIAKYYSWESAFQSAIVKIRDTEIYWNKVVMLSFSLTSLISDGAPIAQPILVFFVYIKMGYSLTFTKAFVTIMLFNILSGPVTALSGMATQYFTCKNSVNKVLEFLEEEDVVEYVDTTNQIDGGSIVVKFESASLGWITEQEAKVQEEKDKKEKDEKAKKDNKVQVTKTTEVDAKQYQAVSSADTDKAAPNDPMKVEINRHVRTLVDISFEVKKGELTVITGPVGSGKTSILKAMLNGLKLFNGKISMNGSVAYHAQQPWILSATVKDNILFGRPEDPALFEKVLDLSCLQADLSSFTKGLETEIGEKGVTLSGGQKARISFARSLYRDTDIVILDDPLSAVDSAVGRKMFSEGIVNYLCGRGKTVILVTHQVHLLTDCKNIIVIDEGKIVAQGSFHDKNVAHYVVSPEDAAAHDSAAASAEDVKVHVDPAPSIETTAPVSNGDSIKKQPSIKKQASVKIDAKKDDEKNEKKLVKDEESSRGLIGFDVYKFYFSYGRASLMILSLVMIMGFLTASTLASFWLAFWGQREAENFVDTGNPLSFKESMFYLKVYAVILMIGVAMNYFKVLLGVGHIVRLNKEMHSKLLEVVLGAPSYWFDVTPLGRIITRFTSDMEQSNFVHYLMWYTFTTCCGVIAAALTICITTRGAALIIIVPLFVAYYFLFIKFSNFTTDLTRCESVAQSPININFMQTMTGIDTIRSYKESGRFYDKIVIASNRLNVASLTKAQTFLWLVIRLQTFGAILSFAITLLTALTLKKQFIPPSQMALALVSIIQLPTTMTGFVMTASSLSNLMSSVQRIKAYIDDVPDEAEYLSGMEHTNRSSSKEIEEKSSTSAGNVEMAKVVSVVKPPPEWPSQGIVQSRELKLGYYGGPDILNGVNFETKSQEKIGVIGRTGSGKSTLVTALFHIEMVRGGEIYIDGIDIATVDIHHLRSKLCIIPQDPVMFVGTVRYNLDPFNNFDDAQIWDVLEKTRMKHDVEHLPNKLTEKVLEGGSNFSVGQRQLICFARALLKKPKILVLDEATASVDNETDSHVQKMIRDLFKDCTVMTIAHRLNTILDSDRIMVLGAGKVIEFDTPDSLLQNPDSHFYKMYADFKKEHEAQ